MGIPANMKRDSLVMGHQIIPSFNKNKYRQAGIPHWKYQSRRIHHRPSWVLPESTIPPYENGKEVGPTTPPVLAQTRPSPLDKYPPVGYI